VRQLPRLDPTVEVSLVALSQSKWFGHQHYFEQLKVAFDIHFHEVIPPVLSNMLRHAG
tara:strand:- start:22 stop:195 length:174 start_codon:yes stop_codon:yes gene_type:complete